MRKETVFLIILLLLFSAYLLPVALHDNSENTVDVISEKNIEEIKKIPNQKSIANNSAVPSVFPEAHHRESQTGQKPNTLSITQHEERIKAYLNLDEERRGQALSEYSESFYPFSLPQREERLALVLDGLNSENRDLRDLNLQLLGSVTPIELVPQFIQLYDKTSDIELQEGLLKLMGYTISDAKEELNPNVSLSVQEEVKSFFLSNIGNFPIELEDVVFETIQDVFTEDEVINIVQQGYFPAMSVE